MILLRLAMHVVAWTGRVKNAMHSDSMHSVVIYGYKEYIFACSMLFRLARGYTHTHDYALGVTRSSAAMRCK